jgi:predicted membrane protein
MFVWWMMGSRRKKKCEKLWALPTSSRQGDTPIGLFVLRSGNAEITMNDLFGNVVVRVPDQPRCLLGLSAVIGSVRIRFQQRQVRTLRLVLSLKWTSPD